MRHSVAIFLTVGMFLAAGLAVRYHAIAQLQRDQIRFLTNLLEEIPLHELEAAASHHGRKLEKDEILALATRSIDTPEVVFVSGWSMLLISRSDNQLKVRIEKIEFK